MCIYMYIYIYIYVYIYIYIYIDRKLLGAIRLGGRRTRQEGRHDATYVALSY